MAKFVAKGGQVDVVTLDLLPPVKRRGRPSTGKAMSPAERKRLQRARAAEVGLRYVTVLVPVDVDLG